MHRHRTLRSSQRESTVDLDLETAWSVIASGAAGPQWYVDAAPFRFRGALDRLVGGGGTRWDPPGHERLDVGDRAGFWEVVEADHAAHRLAMVARVRAPGVVTMTTTALAHASGGTAVHQRIELEPHGLVGMTYLVADLPARGVVSELTMLHLLTVLRRAGRVPRDT